MNKIFKKISIVAVFTAISVIIISHTSFAISVGELLPRIGEDPTITEEYNEVGHVANLPELTKEALFATIIKRILGFSMALTTIALVVASIFYLISRGKEEDITKAKNIILYLIIGMAVMAAAYGIIAGLSRIKFFE